jgi:ferritin
LLNSYNKSSNKIFLDGDIATFDFLCYFRKVQIDEVKEYSDFLNALQLIDPKDKFQLLYFEREYFGE